MTQNTSTAVMAQRREPADSLDYFPTPPWATRALCEFLDRGKPLDEQSCWEPACGEGHMVRPLLEYFRLVYASDVHNYSAAFAGQHSVRDFLTPWETPALLETQPPDWIITNPPYRLAAEFALRAFEIAAEGVALLVRTQFLEGGGRYDRLFAPHPPTWILQFCERVPMLAGRLDAKGSTASAYCWVVWTEPFDSGQSATFHWLPPCRKRLERPGDYPEAPAADPAPAPLLDGGAA